MKILAKENVKLPSSILHSTQPKTNEVDPHIISAFFSKEEKNTSMKAKNKQKISRCR